LQSSTSDSTVSAFVFAAACYQVRLEAMESVAAKAQAPEAAECVQTLVQGVAHLPGWDDKNFQVRGGYELHLKHHQKCQ
jgi:hypothetical protein